MRKVLLAVLVSISAYTGVYAQKTISTISAQFSFPQQEYRKTYPVTGYGLRWNVMYRPSLELPISVGGEIGLLTTSSDSKYFDLYFLGLADRYRVTASNNILSLAFKMRADLLPRKEKNLHVFLDATVGSNLFFSTVDVERESYFGNQQYGGSSSTKGYWALVGGPGAGVEIPVGKSKNVSLSLKASYLFGSNTKYLTDPYIDANGSVFFTERESKTAMILAEGGVKFGIFTRKRNR